jgi:hypothetical protein
MKKLLFLILPVTILFTGCETKRFTVVGNINLEREFQVDNTGSFTESSTINAQDVNDDLDLPDDAVIVDVNIESISAKVLALSGNQTNAVTVNGKIQTGTTELQLFNNLVISIPAGDGDYTALNTLLAEGVQKLRSKIEDYVKNNEFSPVTITVNGDSSPTIGKRVHTRILVKISGSVTYYEEVSLPFFIGG